MATQETAASVDLTSPAVYADWTRVTIRYADLDPNGHVNNGAINQYFEGGRVHFRRSERDGARRSRLSGISIVRFDATYRAALHFPGEVDIGTVLLRLGRSSFDLGQGVFQDGRCIATAEVVSVHIDRQTGQATPIPDDLRAVFEAAQYRSPDEA